MKKRNIKFIIFAILLISLFSSLLYLDSLHHSFHFDDFPNIVENPYIRNPKDFSLFIKGLEVRRNWFRALPSFSFALNYHFHKFNVFGYHLVNLILHILSGILVYFISRSLLIFFLNKNKNSFDGTPETEGQEINFFALMTAMIFVSHPIQVNTVTYIVKREEGMASFFYLLSFFLFIKGSFNQGFKKNIYFIGMVGSFLGSIFSKEIGFTLPIMIILFDLLFLCKTKEEIQKKLMIYIPLSFALFIYIAFFMGGGMLRHFIKGSSHWQWSPWENLLTQSNVIIQYFKLLLLPFSSWLNIDHDFRISTSFFQYPTWISFSVILLLFILSAFLLKRSRWISFCILWFFIVLAPTSSILPIREVMVEYRLYLPIFSYALLISIGSSFLYHLLAKNCSKRLSQAIIIGVFVVILSFYSIHTIERNKIFKDDLTLWSDTVKKSPYSIRPKVNLISAYHRNGLYDQAISISLEMLRKEPHNYEIYNKLGVSYMLKGEYDKAIERLRTAIQIRNDNPEAYNNLGVIYLGRKDFDQAIVEFKQAIHYHPGYAEAYSNLAKALAMKGLLDEAIMEVKRAIRIDPRITEYHFNLAKLYENKGVAEEAIKEYQEALKLNSNFFEARHHLGILYTKMGRYEEGIRQLEEAIKINPRSGKSYFILGINYIKIKEREKAIWNLEKALQYASNEKDQKGVESILNKLRSLPN